MYLKDLLKNYHSIKRQIEELDEEIANISAQKVESSTTDVVKGSQNQFPYVYHNISLHGYIIDDKDAKLLEKKLFNIRVARKEALVRYCMLIKKAEDYLSSIDEADIREIFSLRYFKQLSWEQVAIKIGGGNCADGVRKKHDRYLKGAVV